MILFVDDLTVYDRIMKTTMVALVGTLVTGLVGCTPTFIRVDERFTGEETSLIRRAASDWEVSTGIRIDMVFGEHVDMDTTSNTHNMVKITSRNSELSHKYDSTGEELDNDWIQNKRIVVVVDKINRYCNEHPQYSYNDLFRFTVTHELGHYLGLPHLDSHTAMMKPHLNDEPLPTCVTVEDANAYCVIHEDDGCRQDQMRGCIPGSTIVQDESIKILTP